MNTVYLLNPVARKMLTGQNQTMTIFSQQTGACPDGVMWILLKLMIWRWNLKKNVIVNMMVFLGVFVRHLCYLLVLTNAQVKAIVGVDSVRYNNK